ncbi:MAG: hypothetical protein AAGF92_15790 [Myxococcota bacterium]
MNKQHLTLGIALALATSACTGLGVQTGPTVTSAIAAEQTLDTLWGEEDAPVASVASEIDYRDDSSVADLWVEGTDVEAKRDESKGLTAFIQRTTLTDSVFASDSNTSEVLPK